MKVLMRLLDLTLNDDFIPELEFIFNAKCFRKITVKIWISIDKKQD